ncbi:MAG: DNA gyrase subunit A, partial [Lachnospiraceae bacterium]|nr:DNA gyrase subunit A [Lachnospiraceae bacterium]
DVEELMEIVKGPDFPTGATILGTRGIEESYRTGRGKIRVRAVTDIETMPNGKSRIVVTELPYMVNKARLLEKIAELHREKKIDGITDLRDESDREGTRVVIELRRDVNANVVLNQLFKHTQMQDTFGVIQLCLVNGEPKVLNLSEMLKLYLKHQEDVITRRTRFDLNKAEERAHIIEGLLIALDNIDEVIRLIRASHTTQEAKEVLMERFSLTEAQASAIVEMRLRALTGLEREKLEAEFAELKERIAEYKAILSDEKKLLGVIRQELSEIADKYGDERRTSIGFDDSEIDDEDLIPRSNTVIAMTKLGYIKRMSLDNFKSQHRGGHGIKGMETIEDDYIDELLMTNTHHFLLFFTNLGRVYQVKAYKIPEASRTSRGIAIVNLLQLQPEEKISALIPVEEYKDGLFLFMATKSGVVKKTPLLDFKNINKKGLIAIILKEDDELIEVKRTDGNRDVFLATRFGQIIRFHETDVRSTGRSSMGVRGMNLADQDEVIGMQLDVQGSSLMFVSEKGLGKCTMLEEFSPQFRGGKGVRCYKITEKTGNLIGFKGVEEDNEVMVITTSGTIIRFAVNKTALSGRITSGVKLINLDEGVTVASFAKVRKDDEIVEAADHEGEEAADEKGSEENPEELPDNGETVDA